MASTTPTPSIDSSPAPPIQSLYPIDGGCGCRYIRYRMVTKPLIVQCCHCTWCQRESGSAFAINAMIEANRIVHQQGREPVLQKTPSESGQGQTIARCPKCNVAVWSNYMGPLIRFVKVGTLDRPMDCPPDIHIFTKSKQAWVGLLEGAKVYEKTYEDREEVWPKESLERWNVFQEKVRLWQEKKSKEQEQEQAKTEATATDQTTEEKVNGVESTLPEALAASNTSENEAKTEQNISVEGTVIDEATKKVAALHT